MLLKDLDGAGEGVLSGGEEVGEVDRESFI